MSSSASPTSKPSDLAITTDHDAPVATAPRSMASAQRTNSGSLSHRSSFAENLRSHPPSPRTHRHPSFTQAAVQELLNHPPKSLDSQFRGKDWRQISIGELVNESDVRLISGDTGVEEATKLLIQGGPPNVILVQSPDDPLAASGTFDYNDLNAYLLIVLGLARPDESEVDEYTAIARKAREGAKIALHEIEYIAKKTPLVTLAEAVNVSRVMEIFASGVHRILVTRNGTNHVAGILSQWRLVKFLWENGSSFPVIDQLYPIALKDLHMGTHQVVAVNGDQPLTDALLLMNSEGLSSLAVVDNSKNVIGNISTVDTKLLTDTSSIPLLKSTCTHFISVILSERGMENGKDSFPVFHVTPQSTLAHTVAKLVATRAHRMWLVDSISPANTAPPTPGTMPPVLAHAGPAPSVSSMGSMISGQLTGVVSLTDVLNLFARQSGLRPSDPDEQRQRRRRSSSSSLRPSMDSMSRSSFDLRRS